MPFESELELRSLPKQDAWEVIRPLQYRHYDAQRPAHAGGYQPHRSRVVVVPVGYRTDLASVPRLAWRIVPRDHALARRPAVLHDFIYTNQVHRFTKAEADHVFHQALLEEGMNTVLAWLMWCAVRIGGRGNWGH